MTPLKIKMTLAKSTKGTHVYKSEENVIPTLYIRKAALSKEPPKSITVIIEEVK